MDMQHQIKKPSVSEWIRTAEVLADRLTECVYVYKHNTYIFMAEAERQHKSGTIIKILQGIHTLVDEYEAPAELVSNLKESDEQISRSFATLFREALKILPWVSTDMQKLLKSPWMKGFSGKVAEALFSGDGDEDKGIGSGLPEHGRLPALLAKLVEREEIGAFRPKRDVLSRGELRRHDIDPTLRWVEQNSKFLRSAGRMD